MAKGSDSSDESEYDPLNHIPSEEIEMINEFLESFILDAGDGERENEIDLKHAMKAFPGRIDENNVYRCRG